RWPPWPAGCSSSGGGDAKHPRPGRTSGPHQRQYPNRRQTGRAPNCRTRAGGITPPVGASLGLAQLQQVTNLLPHSFPPHLPTATAMHERSDPTNFLRIAPNVRLGRDVSIHCFVNLYGCHIGDESRIGAFVEIQKNACIGARCKISSHTFICEGVTIED